MSTVVYQINKKNGNKYAYRSESYRDPVTKRPKSRRTYLGRVDPDTGMIIPKGKDGKRNRSKIGKYDQQLPDDFVQELNQQKQQIADLQKEVAELRKQNEAGNKLAMQLKEIVQSFEASSISG